VTGVIIQNISLARAGQPELELLVNHQITQTGEEVSLNFFDSSPDQSHANFNFNLSDSVLPVDRKHQQGIEVLVDAIIILDGVTKVFSLRGELLQTTTSTSAQTAVTIPPISFAYLPSSTSTSPNSNPSNPVNPVNPVNPSPTTGDSGHPHSGSSSQFASFISLFLPAFALFFLL